MSENKIKISVIIPVYNVEKYLEDCLNSIINNSFKEIEIICINNGSTDNSLDVLKRYALRDERIRIFDLSEKGVSKARNHGIKHARGEYIHFVDADDYINNTFYENIYNKALKNDNDIVVCKTIKVFENIEKLPEEYYFTNYGLPLEEWSTSTIWCFIYKKNLEVYFNEKIKIYSEDDLFSFLLFRKIKNFAYEYDSIYYYRQRDNSATTSPCRLKTFFADKKNIIETIITYANKNQGILMRDRKAFITTISMELNAMLHCIEKDLCFLVNYILLLNRLKRFLKKNKKLANKLPFKLIPFKTIRRNLISIKISKNRLILKKKNKNYLNIERT